ncbi:MAG: prenylated flavin chaperone LpdD [Candidatus Thorarchaeota archaeon]
MRLKIERTVDSIPLVVSHVRIGPDLQVTIYGGDEHHIGGVALAYPTQSHYRDATTVSVNTITAPGHKDYVLANTAAETICKELNVPTVVIVGIHVDNATKDQISAIVKEVESMVNEMIAYYQKNE